MVSAADLERFKIDIFYVDLISSTFIDWPQTTTTATRTTAMDVMANGNENIERSIAIGTDPRPNQRIDPHKMTQLFTIRVFFVCLCPVDGAGRA